MAVTISTITTTTYTTLYGILTNTSTGLTDTVSPARTRTTWVRSAFPDEYATNFAGYPIVTIEVNHDCRLVCIGTSERMANINGTFTIYAKEAVDVDTLTDDITNQIYVTGLSTLESAYLYQPVLSDTTTQTVFREKDKVHIRTIPFSFKWIG